MVRDKTELLAVPTRARSEEEQELLDDILFDQDLKGEDLKKRILNHLNDRYALVFWYHYNGIKPSFENAGAAVKTQASYNGKQSLPQIICVREYKDIA